MVQRLALKGGNVPISSNRQTIQHVIEARPSSTIGGRIGKLHAAETNIVKWIIRLETPL